MEDIRTEELMNEVTNEAVEGVVTTDPGKGFKVAAIIGVVALAGVGICKLGKKIIAKIKARKIESEQADDLECVEVEAVEIEEAE